MINAAQARKIAEQKHDELVKHRINKILSTIKAVAEDGYFCFDSELLTNKEVGILQELGFKLKYIKGSLYTISW